MVKVHNKWRAAKGVGPVSWSQPMADYAQKWANHLAQNRACRLIHRGNEGKKIKSWGENLSMWGGSKAHQDSPTTAVNNWVTKEKKYWDGAPRVYGQGRTSSAGHYTQVVWAKSKKIGCGRALCKVSYGYKVVVVCNYDPPGNYVGQPIY